MKRFIVALLLSGCVSNAFADKTTPVPSSQQQPAQATSQPANAGQPNSTDTQQTCNKTDVIATVPPPSVIKKLDKGEAPYQYPYMIKLGEFVTVQVPHDKYSAYFTKQDDNIQPTPVLYINELAINGLSWVSSGCENFSFYLTRTEESRDVWGKILSKLNGKDVPVGIGTAQKGYIADIGTAQLTLTTTQGTFWWYLLMAIVTVSIFWLGKSSGLLRDLPKNVSPTAAQGTAIPAGERPFSLGRVQMAFWFVLTVGAYTYIWLKTGDISHIIPDSILALIGISAGTTVLSAVVDSNAAAQTPEKASGNFLKDLLSDSDGISFHRFQMFVWTIVLGSVFIQKVCATLIMPDFDAQLLGLMGVASGTYLGFKIPAAATATAAPTVPAAPAVPAQEHPAAG